MISCWVINLDGERARQDFMQAQFETLGVTHHFNRLAAVDFRAGISETAAPHYRPHKWGRYWELSLGEIGCFESHLSLWRKCADGSDPAIVIMEDDILVSKNFPRLLEKITDAATEFDVLHMDGAAAKFRMGPLRDVCGLGVRDIQAVCPSAACYAISQAGARKLVALAEVGYCDHADDFVNRPGPDFRVLQLTPAIAIQTMWATRPDLGVFASALQPATGQAKARAKGPFAYRMMKKIRQSGLRVTRIFGGDANLRRSGGVIGMPDLADDLPQYRD